MADEVVEECWPEELVEMGREVLDRTDAEAIGNTKGLERAIEFLDGEEPKYTGVCGHTAGLARIKLVDEKDDGGMAKQRNNLTEQIAKNLLRKLHRDQDNPFCGVVLAGGRGSRLGELTKVTNKHLLPVGYVPMIYHPIQKLVYAGIKDIMLVTGTEHMGDFVNLLGSGKSHGCRLTYRVQEEAGGVAQALGLAEWFCNGCKRPVVLLGDNIFHDSLHDVLSRAWDKPDEAFIIIKEVTDPGRYGVVELDGPLPPEKPYDWSRIISIEEKPAQPRGKHAVTGIYIYPNDVFDVIKTLKPSTRGELEITDVNNYYLGTGRLNFHIMEGYWTDAGTLHSWHDANRIVIADKPHFEPDEPYVPETLE